MKDLKNFSLLLIGLLLTGCEPTVHLQAPKDPIVINIKLDHELRIKLEKDVEDMIHKNPDIF